MLVNLKLKKILPLAAACLLVASGVYAGGPEEPDHREGVSRRKASNLELKGQSSKRQKPTGDQEGEEDRTLSSLESLSQDVWMLLLDFLPPSDLLNMRETSKRLRAVASQRDLWQSKYPLFNLSQSWQNGPDENSFLNTTLNIVVHRILMQLGAVRFEIFCPGLQNAESFSINVRKLAEISDQNGFVKGFCDYFNKISTDIQDSQELAAWMETPEVKSLEKKGNAEKRLVQFFHFLNREPFDKNSDLYVAPRPGEPKPFVELISDELALRERIKNAPEAELPQLYDQLLTDGVYATTQDFKKAGLARVNAGQFQQAAALYETVLARMGADATAQDFRNAGLQRFQVKQYEQAANHFEAVLTREDATTQDFRYAGLARTQAKHYEQATAHYEAVLGRKDATTYDSKKAKESRLRTQKYEQPQLQFDVISYSSDHPYLDLDEVERPRLKIGQAKKKK